MTLRALPAAALAGILLAGSAGGPVSAAPPAASMVPLEPVQVHRPFRVAWTGTPSGPAITGYDVRYRRAPWNGGFGGLTTWKANTPAESAIFPGARGFTYCFSVRARDGAGPAGPWSTGSCTAVPLDDRDVDRSAGWVLAGLPIDYGGTILRSSTGGAWLRLTGVQAKRLYIVIREPVVGGDVRLYWKGRLVAVQHLDANPPEIRDVHLVIAMDAIETGTFELRVIGGTGPVRIDGVAVLRS